MDKDIEKILFTNEEIKTAVQKLGKKLTEDYHDKKSCCRGHFTRRGAVYDRLDTSDGLLYGN